jgi:hypothetical protein
MLRGAALATGPLGSYPMAEKLTGGSVCHLYTNAPTMKLLKWLKKSANDHEARSSFGRQRR